MRFRTKLALSLAGVSIFSTMLAIGINLYQTRKFMIAEVKSKVMSIAGSTASQIDGDLNKQIRVLQDEQLPSYEILRQNLRKARNANRRNDVYIKYLYTFYPDPDHPGKLLFSVDPEETEKDVSHAGTENPGASSDQILDHLDEIYSSGRFTKDPWGVWMTGYAPIFDSQGNYAGTLGADIGVKYVNSYLFRLYYYGLIAFLLSALIAIIIASIHSKNLSKALKEIQNATLETSKGNFSHKIYLNSQDEFQDLAESLNKMNDSLAEKERLKIGFARYVSRHVLDKIIKSDGSTVIEGERKKITVFFSDIRDFTHLAESMPPEKVVIFLNEYFKTMLDIIFKYNGMLDKLIGDGIMAEFGAPIDDPQQERNAILTALEMEENLKILNDRWKQEGKPNIRIGIGIHTGEAVVGTIGSDSRMEYTAIGDTVNIASRLEQASRDKNVCIVISEETFKALKNEFAAENLGPLMLKGKEKAIIAYAILPISKKQE